MAQHNSVEALPRSVNEFDSWVAWLKKQGYGVTRDTEGIWYTVNQKTGAKLPIGKREPTGCFLYIIVTTR